MIHPLWDMANVIVSPHMAGDVTDTHERFVQSFLRILGGGFPAFRSNTSSTSHKDSDRRVDPVSCDALQTSSVRWTPHLPEQAARSRALVTQEDSSPFKLDGGEALRSSTRGYLPFGPVRATRPMVTVVESASETCSADAAVKPAVCSCNLV